jgi:hypothetical protein
MAQKEANNFQQLTTIGAPFSLTGRFRPVVPFYSQAIEPRLYEGYCQQALCYWRLEDEDIV